MIFSGQKFLFDHQTKTEKLFHFSVRSINFDGCMRKMVCTATRVTLPFPVAEKMNRILLKVFFVLTILLRSHRAVLSLSTSLINSVNADHIRFQTSTISVGCPYGPRNLKQVCVWRITLRGGNGNSEQTTVDGPGLCEWADGGKPNAGGTRLENGEGLIMDPHEILR
jgi:hypothetical protein